METNQKITYGLIGLLSLIVATLGGTIFLTPEQLDNAYICTTNQNVVIADHLSSTLKTAYWVDELNVTKSKVCTNGIWRSLQDYAKENNIEINVLLKNLNEEMPVSNETIPNNYGNVIQYLCDQTKCVRIK